MAQNIRSSGYTPGSPTDKVDYINSNPNEQLGFEINPIDVEWEFTPEFYPSDFTQRKKKELDRYGGNCGGESVSVKSIKNREFHAAGLLLEGEINIFQALLDYEGKVDILSPLTPAGGMECFIKQGELGNQKGWDPHNRQWMFKYTMDLVSTGRDEYDSGNNAIVTAISNKEPAPVWDGPLGLDNMTCMHDGLPRSAYYYTGNEKDTFERWQNCNITTQEFKQYTNRGEGMAKVNKKRGVPDDF